MDRVFRVLTIYNRLLQHKNVNKKTLTQALGSSPRTIQRDIDDIRNFLYEAKSWVGVQSEITYDYKSESYTLKKDKSESQYFMYDILNSLYLTTPKISRHFYQYLKMVIIKYHGDQQDGLLQYLNHFEVDDEKETRTSVSVAVQALNENRYLKHHKHLILPISLHYQMFSFHLIYQFNHEIYITDIHKMDLTLANETFDCHQKEMKHDYITFEVSKEVWLNIHRYYQIHVIENYDEDHIMVTFKMTRPEAIQLCFLYRSQICVISPRDLREQVIDELLFLQSTYLKQQIQH